MKVYLVGGALRDQLLNLPSKDRDYVVVGANIEDLLNQGFRQVGRNFPVFLHPKTHEEYALARTEKKTGVGYTGFYCNFSSDVTLETDLKRRDITINALAQDIQTGEIFDFYGGLHDLQNKIIRHVSNAFCEDPLRLVRVLRFAAQLKHLNFTIAPETWKLLEQMVRDGEITHLKTERILQELNKVFQTKNPELFFQLSQKLNALELIFKMPLAPSDFEFTKKLSQKTTEPLLFFIALILDLNLNPSNTELFLKNLQISQKSINFAKDCVDFCLILQKNCSLQPDVILKFFTKMRINHNCVLFDKFILLSQAFGILQTKIKMLLRIAVVLQNFKPKIDGSKEIAQQIKNAQLSVIAKELQSE